MSLLNNSNAISTGGGYNLENSLRFRESASANLLRTPTTAGNRKTWTWSAWVKRGNVADSSYYCLFGVDGVTPTDRTEITFSANAIFIYEQVTTATISLTTTGLFRDPSAWYHIVVAIDTAQATSTNRVKLYVNGEQITSFSSATYPSLNYNTFVNSTNTHVTGARRYSNGTINKYFDGYQTEVNFVDGQALTPSDFGEYNATTGVWQPIEYTGTYGTNGFYLPFKPTTQATGFNTVLYTGTGAAQAITGVGFSPDLVWGKNRGATASHNLLDTVRGATKRLFSNSTEAEVTTATSLTSFDSDGFTLGSDTGLNTNTNTYVAWCWDAGSGSPISNTDGTITSTVKANPATGFSVVTWTGSGAIATIGHGLGVAPGFIIVKQRDAVRGWVTYNKNLASNQVIYLNVTSAANTDTTAFNATTPTSSVFSVGTSADTNQSSGTYVAYCFSEVAGYSKFGSYTGNGSTTGPVVTTGFKPAFVLIKKSSSSGTNWMMYDNTRNVANPANNVLTANTSNAEVTSTNQIDFNSDGFQITGSSGGVNTSGDTYIYMAFADTRDAQFNFDASGNKNNWTANNINSNASGDTTYDIMTDVPTLTDEDTANFAVINPLNSSTTTVPTTSNANLRIVGTVNAYQGMYMSMAIPSTGKWYFEYTYDTKQTVGGNQQTLITPSPSLSGSGATSDSTTLYGLYSNSNYQYGSTGQTDLGIAAVAGNTQMVAYDSDTGKLWWGYNGTWFLSGNPSAGTNPLATQTASIEKYIANVTYGTSGTTSYNFGQRPFAYTPPTGYLKLNTFNLPDSSIEDGSENFDTVLYTGDGTDDRFINTGFSTDFTWLKNRGTTNSHYLSDSVRGNEKSLFSNNTAAEFDYAAFGGLSFSTGGITVDTGTSNVFNTSGGGFVTWNWKAGGTAVSNTDGTITSQVSANPTAGFSVVTFTGNSLAGATVGHGLGVAPKMVILKNLAVDNWIVHNNNLPAGQVLLLNGTNAAFTSATSITTSATTLNLTNSSAYYATGKDFVSYVFAEVEGFSKFGSYTGNGSTDGPFIYTGFRPAYIMIKRTNGVANWVVLDATRDSYNVGGLELFPNTSGAENNNSPEIDFLSNGVKLRWTYSGTNASGGTYIYMAFASNPFKNSLAR